MLSYYISTHPIKKIKNNTVLSFNDICDISNDGLYNLICKITLIDLYKNKDNKDIISLKLEDDSSSITVRSYQNALEIKQSYKKGDVVYVNISKKNMYYYLNSIKKMEV